jgi:hypothetical protein
VGRGAAGQPAHRTVIAGEYSAFILSEGRERQQTDQVEGPAIALSK